MCPRLQHFVMKTPAIQGIIRPYRVGRGADPEALARDPRRGIVDGERLQKIQSLTSAERKLLRLCGLFFASFIIRLSMNEAIAIYGVVLAFLSRSLIPMLPFAVAAIALNVACRPRIDPFLERATYLAR